MKVLYFVPFEKVLILARTKLRINKSYLIINELSYKGDKSCLGQIQVILAAFFNSRFWAWPRSVRRYFLPKANARIYRYPSPGSEPANLEFNQIDYKTAYRDSTHNIRYNVNLHPLTKSYLFMSDPLGETVTEKYKKFVI